MKQKTLTYFAIAMMGLGFALAAWLYTSQQQAANTQLATDHVAALTPDHAMRKGSPGAKVTIVEFLDPACGTCKQFHPVVQDLLKKFPTKIKLVVRYAPFHPGSDQMVAILEAARKQGQYWNVLDIMFESQQFWTVNHTARPDLFWGYLKGYGINVDQIRQDMQDPNVRKIIQQDLADGELLNVTKTPTFFVNGKPLPSFGYEQLMALVASELKANY